MTGPRHRRRLDPEAPLVDLADVLSDDDIVERLRCAALRADVHAARPLADLSAVGAAGRRRPSGRHRARPARIMAPAMDPAAGDEVFALLQQWRSDITVTALPPVPIVPAAVRSAARWRRWSTAAARAAAPRSVRPALAISGALAGLLMGSAVVSAKDATPEEPLFALTTIFWPHEAASKAAMGPAWVTMNALAQAIEAGDPRKAQLLTKEAADAIGQVDVDDQPEGWTAALRAAEVYTAQSQTPSSAAIPTPSKPAVTASVSSSASTPPTAAAPKVTARSTVALALPVTAPVDPSVGPTAPAAPAPASGAVRAGSSAASPTSASGSTSPTSPSRSTDSASTTSPSTGAGQPPADLGSTGAAETSSGSTGITAPTSSAPTTTVGTPSGNGSGSPDGAAAAAGTTPIAVPGTSAANPTTPELNPIGGAIVSGGGNAAGSAASGNAGSPGAAALGPAASQAQPEAPPAPAPTPPPAASAEPSTAPTRVSAAVPTPPPITTPSATARTTAKPATTPN